MPLPRKASTGIFDHINVNVYNVITKQIAFTGSQKEAANFIGIRYAHMSGYLTRRCVIKKLYTIRLAKSK